jgi:hypothetical protein
MRRPTIVLLFALLTPTTVSAAPKSFSSEEEFSVIGEVLKPEITVVISRENLNKAYDLRLDEDFLQRIVDSVKSEPF